MTRRSPANYYWLETKLTTDVYEHTWSQIKKASVDYKNNLLGHISSSLVLPDENNILGNFILDKSKELEYAYHPNLSIRSMWVNFQKKYEYNPMHLHDDILSFVIWMKIPYKYEDEMQHETAKNVNSCMNGSFEFVYTNLLGQITTYQYVLSKEAEGGVLIFPSALHHAVHPFYTSDGERISISGNIR